MGLESPKPYVRTAYCEAIGRTGYEIGSAGYDPGNKTIGSANRVRCVDTRSHTPNGRIYGSWTFQVTMNA